MATIGEKKAGFKKAMSDGRTRLVFFGGMALAFIVAVVALNSVLRGPSKGDGNAQLREAPTPSERSPAYGGNQPVNTQAYERLTEESDAQAVADAKASGGTAMPVPRVGMAEPEAAPPAVMPAAASPGSTDESSAKSTEAANAIAAAQQAHEAELGKRYERMATQYDRLLQRWSTGREAESMRAPEVAEPPQSAVVTAAVPMNPESADAGAPSIRANETALAVSISEANTDDQMPIVRARLLSGPAKGALLLGSIEVPQGNGSSNALIRFNLLAPENGQSVAIDAIAIDPRTSRASVASSVNRHTVSRLGALFFSSILGGVSEGLLKGGQQERIVTTGQNVVVQRDAYSDRDLAMIGLGRVGTNGAQMMQGAINRRPTVKLNLNTEIGVLFLQDVILGAGATRTGAR